MTKDKPLFAIIGRPNVGKSTLFNYLVESRRSLVKNQPGVTRDILFEEAELWGQSFEVVDTGGITEAKDETSTAIRKYILEFIESVDYLLVVMDYKSGLCPEDRDIVRIAKQSGKEFLIIINKVDKVEHLDLAGSEFYEFGMELVTCSFESRFGIDRLLEWISQRLSTHKRENKQNFVFSIVGQPNVGKSSLTNYLLGSSRVLVSPLPGTTTDSVDFHFEYNKKSYLLIDTAGLRRSAKREKGVETLSTVKTSQSIKRSDLVLLMIDGLKGPSDQDAKILQEILEAHKGVILVVGKLDRGEREKTEFRKNIREKIAETFHFYVDIPIVFVSAKTGKGLKDLFSCIETLREKLNIRISTPELNEFFINVIRQAPAPVHGSKNVKFYYLTQTRQVPPGFIAFANEPKGVDKAYRRFLIKRIKKRWELEGVPIRIFCHEKLILIS